MNPPVEVQRNRVTQLDGQFDPMQGNVYEALDARLIA
jgi:hypothetical protein